ncbi:MAG: tRNA dihydrouridine synthase DusB [Candidatus Omnitrophica bacterium]|nr:tRNA dihydrouridine synthase DusB [Candidatus Omnitrophota bacterium]
MLKIGKLELASNFILAPMAGITDYPFRMFCRKFGCAMAFTEMINVRSLGYHSKKTRQMLFSDDKDKPLGVQILGCEPKFILRALDILKNYKFDILDFNAACPVKKVIRRGEGAALLKEPQKLSRLLKLIVGNSAAPVTVKIRTGWDKDSVNARAVALAAQDAGVSALFIHGRTKIQGYSGAVDYPAIRQAKAALDIPVIASGDIYSAALAKKMFEETGCDAIAIARGALGNPWIFRELSSFFSDGRTLPRPAIEEKISALEEHLDAYIDFYGEKNGVILFRKFFSWYTRGLRKIRPLRERASRAKRKSEVMEMINAWVFTFNKV